jgi:hypothetical protein
MHRRAFVFLAVPLAVLSAAAIDGGSPESSPRLP